MRSKQRHLQAQASTAGAAYQEHVVVSVVCKVVNVEESKEEGA